MPVFSQEEGKKLYITVSVDTYRKFADLAKRYRLTLSQYGNICILSGMDAFLRAMSPYEAFSPEQMAELVMALEKKGVKVDLDELKGE